MEKTACIEPAVVPWARVRIGATVVTVTRDTGAVCDTSACDTTGLDGKGTIGGLGKGIQPWGG